MPSFDAYPHLKTVVDAVLVAWPDHQAYINRSFNERSDAVMQACEGLCSAIIRMSETVPGGLPALCQDYRYFSEHVVLPEQLQFQRSGQYSTKTFAEAEAKFYSNPVFMRQYANCLALSTVLWDNHAKVFAAFLDYLPSLPRDTRLMEIGPAHGFALYFAATSPNVASLVGWDVSPTAIEHTRQVLESLGVAKPVELKVQDLFAAGTPPAGGGFDAIVLGEVIEHLEDPRSALRAVAAWLRPEGRMWLTTPVNSPFPDHIHLFRTIDEVHELVRDCGLEIVHEESFPMSGVTLEKAIKRKQPISCAIVARRAA